MSDTVNPTFDCWLFRSAVKQNRNNIRSTLGQHFAAKFYAIWNSSQDHNSEQNSELSTHLCTYHAPGSREARRSIDSRRIPKCWCICIPGTGTSTWRYIRWYLQQGPITNIQATLIPSCMNINMNITASYSSSLKAKGLIPTRPRIQGLEMTNLIDQTVKIQFRWEHIWYHLNERRIFHASVKINTPNW